MKICTISDTHSLHEYIEIPECDMIIHAGDCSHNSIQFYKFLDWFSELPIKYKILVAGNHDIEASNLSYAKLYELCQQKGIIYLEDTSIIIEGIKIHGSPWSNTFGPYPFMADDFELQDYWNLIPEDTNILITHGPAYSYLDRVNRGNYNVGSKTLTHRIDELKELRYHICGHIHESHGIIRDNTLTRLNVSIYEYGKQNKKPTIFEIEVTK